MNLFDDDLLALEKLAAEELRRHAALDEALKRLHRAADALAREWTSEEEAAALRALADVQAITDEARAAAPRRDELLLRLKEQARRQIN